MTRPTTCTDVRTLVGAEVGNVVGKVVGLLDGLRVGAVLGDSTIGSSTQIHVDP